ncbi:NAD(+) diphosphatase [Specibacter cremeus]|uniref:NAD(+) diphosphatase n=1 Tax=Specibacter cremeus TaxID=1629051 RepID=UPI000F7AD62B|nr:NAD(+) diphosphatase [Specibacter cremeus]
MIQPLPWPDAVLDRDSDNRQEPGFLDAVRTRASRRLMIIQRGRTLVRDGRIRYLRPDELPAGVLAREDQAVYLGAVLPGLGDGAGTDLPAGTEVLMLDVTDDDDPLAWVPGGAVPVNTGPGDTVLIDYREGAEGLGAVDAGIFVEAQGVANWHRTHPRCPRCGSATTLEWAGWMRRCVADGSEHFPRTDPAVIVAIIGADDRILLANNASWETNHFSTVAGFVESGENLEQAVVREIAEEVGVRLHTPTYVGSQAWPFPRSLMLGFLARTDDVEPMPDGVEVVRARWFGRAELQAAVLSGEVVISRRTSIARSLIEHWYGGRIANAGETPVAPVIAGSVAP